MNINKLVIECLKPINMPVCPGNYTGKKNEYIVFNYAGERPVIFGDNIDLIDITSVQVHCFTEQNPQKIKKRIRRCLRSGGFIITDTEEISAKEEFRTSASKPQRNYIHIIISAEIEGVINDEEE
ncbi:MAG: hypothetical protein IJA02_08920 [Clostridia bacterium]|nr:hypothetical protein [Clostridia bacterium]